MMTREKRAKQFMPFDAMKGLQEALLDREERHLRTERHEMEDDAAAKLNAALIRVAPGMRVNAAYYRSFHDAEKTGRVEQVDFARRFLKLSGETVFFDDIYSLEIIEF